MLPTPSLGDAPSPADAPTLIATQQLENVTKYLRPTEIKISNESCLFHMILITDDLDQEIERTLEKVSALGDCMILEFIYILFLFNIFE